MSSSASPSSTPVLTSQVVRFAHVVPDRGAIERLVHLQPGRDNHRRWFELLDQILTDSSRLLRPRGVYRIDAVLTRQSQRIVLASGVEFGGSVSRFLEHTVFIASFVVTIGSALERLSRGWLRAGRVMQGTIADAIASEAAEATAERLRREVRTWAHARGLDVTPAYSPGYCGLTLHQQIPLFASLPVHQINVRLTPSCLMLPLKSISGLIGIGPAGKVDPDAYPCEACDHPDCVQRRAQFNSRHGAGDGG